MLLVRNLLNIKRIAYKNIKEDSVAFFIEKCYRYYSRTYHIPLDKAYNETPERVCQVFMEDEMSNYTADQMEETLAVINNKVEPLLQDIEQIKSTALSDDEWIAQQNLELKQEEEKAAKKDSKQAEIIKKTHDALASLATDLKKIKE